MEEDQIGKVVVEVAVRIHREIGPGLLESVYEVILAHELRRRGLQVDRQVSVPIVYAGLKFDEGFRVERLVNISPLPTTLAPRVAFGRLT